MKRDIKLNKTGHNDRERKQIEKAMKFLRAKKRDDIVRDAMFRARQRLDRGEVPDALVDAVQRGRSVNQVMSEGKPLFLQGGGMCAFGAEMRGRK